MPSSEKGLLSLSFGLGQRVGITLGPNDLTEWKQEVPALPDVPASLDDALSHPLDYPPFEQCVIPDDRIALALDPSAPAIAEMVAAVWRVLERRGVHPKNVFLVQPADPRAHFPADPRRSLPPEAARAMHWILHDPGNESSSAYVASTASGDRVYLSRTVVEADVAVSIGQIRHDPLIGYSGGHSAFYPALSRPDAIRRAQGQGHDELGPEDERPLRQLIDEVGWLLGSQFTLQAVPASGGQAAAFLAGAPESVMKAGRALLARHWQLELDQRCDLIVAAVERSSGSNGWKEAGAALATCRNLVARGGRILLLTDLQELPDKGIELIRTFETPREALKPLRALAPDDLIAATQFASAADWARCYLFSRLPSDLAEDLFCMPVEHPEEIQRLVSTEGGCVVLSSAQDVFGRIRR